MGGRERKEGNMKGFAEMIGSSTWTAKSSLKCSNFQTVSFNHWTVSDQAKRLLI